MYELLQGIRFLLNSRSEYGVHSPFVFNLLTRCVYLPPSLKRGSPQDLFERVGAYCGLERIGVCPQLGWPQGRWPQIDDPSSGDWDLIAVASPSRALEFMERVGHKCVIFIYRPHRVPNERLALVRALADPRFRVVIDFFRGAFLFPRPQQDKEVFRIRLK